MDVIGTLLEVFETQQVSDRFQKREFVIEFAENPQYPEYIKFELVQDKVSLIDSFQVNQSIQVFFNLRGRRWTSPQGETKYFNTLQAWRLSVPQAAGAPPAGGGPAPGQASAPAGMPTDNFPMSDGSDEDELPF